MPTEPEQPSIFAAIEATSYREKPKSGRPVKRAPCGCCTAEKVSLELSSDRQHLVWRFHNYETWARTRLPCQASFTRLCDAPARVVIGLETPVCPCQAIN